MKLFRGVVILTSSKLNSFQAELRSNVHHGELEGGKTGLSRKFKFASNLIACVFWAGRRGRVYAYIKVSHPFNIRSSFSLLQIVLDVHSELCFHTLNGHR